MKLRIAKRVRVETTPLPWETAEIRHAGSWRALVNAYRRMGKNEGLTLLVLWFMTFAP